MLYQIQTLDAECAAAFKCVRAARAWFMAVALLTLLAVPFAAVMIRFVGVLNPPPSPTTSQPATGPAAEGGAKAPASATAPAGTGDAPKPHATAWRPVLQCILRAAGILAPIVGVLLVITMFMGAQVSIIARSGGIGSFFSAFFWSVILLAMLLPWQNVFPATLTAGIAASLGQIEAASRQLGEGDTLQHALFHARFLGYPLAALMVWVLVLVKFGRGYGAMDFSTSVSASKGGEAADTGAAAPNDRPVKPAPGA